jgi:hypothetical protein
MDQELVAKKPAAYRVAMITFKFTNDYLHKNWEFHFPVDIVVRRKVMVEPTQVAFSRDIEGQKRTVLVQSLDPIAVDSVTCDSTCVKTALHRLDDKNLIVEITYLQGALHGDAPKDLACQLLSGGKVVESIPVSILDLH